MSDRDNKETVQRQIDENLRRAFQRKVEEDVPQRFLDLVNKLKTEKSNGSE